jgi:predicted small lipoprotein YifL
MRRFSPSRQALLGLVTILALSSFAAAQDKGPIKPSPAEAGADPSMAKPEGAATPAPKAQQARDPESTVGLAPPEQPINNANPNVAGQVVPSSRETAAHDEAIFLHDQQPVLTHTFNFTADQKQAIVDAIAQGKDNAVAAPFDIRETVVLPATVQLNPIPESIVAQMPWVKPYRYVKFGEKIAIVDANLRYVAAIIE